MAADDGDVLLLITVSEDRTFKLWDLRARAVAYSSAVLTASPLLAVAVDAPTHGRTDGGAQQPCRFAVGSEDGTVQLFEVRLRASPAGGSAVVAAVRAIRMLAPHTLLGRAEWTRPFATAGAGFGSGNSALGAGGSPAECGPAVVSSLPAWRRQVREGLALESSAAGASADDDEATERAHASNAVLLLQFVPQPPERQASQHSADGADDGRAGARARRVAERPAAALAPIPSLVVATVAHLLQIDLASFAVAPLVDPSAGKEAVPAPAGSAPLAAAAYLAPHRIFVGLRPFAHVLDLSIVSAAPAVGLLPAPAAGARLSAPSGPGGGGSVDAGLGRRAGARYAEAEERWSDGAAEEGAEGDGADGGSPPAWHFEADGGSDLGYGHLREEGEEEEGSYRAGSYDDDDEQDDGGERTLWGARARPEPATHAAADEMAAMHNMAAGVSLRAAEAPPASSPLARALALARPKQQPLPASSRARGGAGRSRPVKSSGYGTTAPVMRLHAGGPSTLAARAKRGNSGAAAGREHGGRGGGGALSRMAPYNRGREPAHFSPVPMPVDWHAHPLHASAILRVAYSHDGSRLASSAQSGTIALTRLPALRYNGESALLVGHTSAVRALQWSHCGRRLISASDDGSAILWDVSPESGIRSDPALRIGHLLHEPADAQLPGGAASVAASATGAIAARPALAGRGLGPLGAVHNARAALGGGHVGIGGGAGGGPARAKNVPLGSEVRAARFYYLDQLVLLGCGPSMLVYSLAQQHGGSGKDGGAVARPLTSCALGGGTAAAITPRYRLAHRWSPGAQQVTAVCAPNDCLSPAVLVACSDKSLHVYDMHTARPALSLSMADLSGGGHSRPIRSIALAPDSSDLALTSAADSTVRLWDLRAGRSVRCFSAHVNGHHAIGAAFSPCMRYVATGGESKHASLYSLQSSTLVQSLGGHLDVVSDIAFHPRHPQLATACFDGRCRFWNNDD